MGGDFIRPAEKGQKEPIEIKKRPKYYDHSGTINNTCPNPLEAESPLYNREEISKNRRDENAPKVWVVNDSDVDIWVRVSATADFEDFSEENVIHPSDGYKVYYNVFELRLRSKLAGAPYRVSEYEIQKMGAAGGAVTVSGSVVLISGQCVCTSVSGDIVNAIVSGIDVCAFVCVSGDVVEISGQCVCISGETVLTLPAKDEFIDITSTPVSITIVSTPISLLLGSPVPDTNPKDDPETWINSPEVLAPLAGTSLVSKNVDPGNQGFIYGFFIESNEPNEFLISWTSGGNPYTIRIIFQFQGEVTDKETVPINEGLPADSLSTISITNVNDGNIGMIYQASLLFAET